MIEKHGDGYEVSCDFCSHQEVWECISWQETIAEIKQDGWQISRVNNEWFHKCPSCKEEEEMPNDF